MATFHRSGSFPLQAMVGGRPVTVFGVTFLCLYGLYNDVFEGFDTHDSFKITFSGCNLDGGLGLECVTIKGF